MPTYDDREKARAAAIKGQAAMRASMALRKAMGSSARRKQMENEVWYCATHAASQAKVPRYKNELRRLLMEMKEKKPLDFMDYLKEWLPRPPREQPLPAVFQREETEEEVLGGSVRELRVFLESRGAGQLPGPAGDAAGGASGVQAG